MNTAPCMVWLPADHRLMGDHGHQMPFLLLGDKYARAVKVGAECQPVMFPLADAGQKAAQMGLRNITFLEVDLMTLDGLDVPEGGFDVIISSGVRPAAKAPESR